MIRHTVALGLLLAALVGASHAHVRLRDPGTGSPLSWSQPGAVSVVISATGSDDLLPFEHLPAIRNSFEAWNSLPGSLLRLVEDTSPVSQSRTDHQSLDLHQLLFDEDDSTGFFPPGSGIVAITPVRYTPAGTILDADVIFNGQEFRFSTRGTAGAMDLQNIATHELGHLVGLDHTGWGGATMYPFVSPGQRFQRSLSLDELNGARELSGTLPAGTITGRILRLADSTLVSGAHVSAVDSVGRTVGGTLTELDGSFRLEGLSAGLFRVSVNPLRGVVGAENLAVARPVHTDFETFTLPDLLLMADETVDGGLAFAPPQGLLRLGERGETLPLRAVPGATTGPHVLSGSLLTAGTTLSSTDPDVSVQVVSMNGVSVEFLLSTAPGAPPGHCDLVARRAGVRQDRIPAAIEITAGDPSVSSVLPQQGDRAGGTSLTISGSGFRPGLTVVLGQRSYRDGSECSVLDDSTIDLGTLASGTGLFDLAVIDATGAEGRLASAFRFTVDPVVDSVFPRAGSFLGGTHVVLKGRDFEPDVVVRLAGVTQSVQSVDPETIRITTSGGPPGTGLSLTVENPGVAPAAVPFDVVAAVDPRLSALQPASGLPGDRVRVLGTGFTPASTVLFGASPETGAGGVPSPSVTFVSSSELDAAVPGGLVGPVAVLVLDSSTAQASALELAFTVEAAPSRSSGGGFCQTRMETGPPDARTILGGAGWFFLLLLFALGRRTARAPA